jgi:hypothetical protein
MVPEMAIAEGAVRVCTHENPRATRCHLHMGWCGTCLDCGKRIHAPVDSYYATGKLVFKETKFHEQDFARLKWGR